MTVAVAERPVSTAPEPRARTVGDRLLAAMPLATVFFWACLIFAYQAWAHRTPWLFSDEIEYTDLSRAIAATGHPAIRGVPHSFESLYVYLLAPVWWIHSAGAAYAVAKYLNVALMASAIFPTYGLARMLVRPPAALVAATLTIAVPALSYTSFLITEPLAYLWAAVCFWLIVKALVTRRAGWIAGAVVTAALAGFVRNELRIVIGVALGSLAWFAWTSDEARRRRRGWGWVRWTGLGLGCALVAYAAYRVIKHFSTGFHLAFVDLPDRTLRYGVWAAGALTIGLGVLPVVAGLTTLARPRAPRTPAQRAFVGLLASAIVWFCLYAAAKAAYLSTVFAIRVEERNLFYLIPLIAIAFAVWLDSPRVNLAVLAASGALVGYLLAATPYQLGNRPYSDAPGLAGLTWLNRTFHWGDAQVRTALMTALAVSLLLVVAASFARLGRVGRPLLAVASLLALAWALTGEFSAANGSNSFARRFYNGLPHPLDWVDRANGGARTAYLGTGITDGNGVWSYEFWNRSLQRVGSLDGSAPGPGTVIRPVAYKKDGSMVDDPGTPYVLVDNGVDVGGSVVRRNGQLTLLRVNGPLRLRSAVTGVASDGWAGAEATWSRYAFPRPERGILSVRLSRDGWRVPARVRITVGTLVPPAKQVLANPCYTDPCGSLDPQIGKVTAREDWFDKFGGTKLFEIPVTTPFRVEVSTEPTFRPIDYGLYDQRHLGVKPSFTFTPTG